MIISRWLVTALAFLTLAVSAGVCDTNFSGTTVEYRSGRQLSGILVTIKDASNDRDLGSDTTDSAGEYEINIGRDPEYVNVTYDPPDGSDMDPAGRSNLARVGPDFELDTAGLTNKRSRRRDRAEQEQVAKNTRGYVNAGGDSDKATAAVRDAVDRFGDRYHVIAQRWGLRRAFERRRMPFPF